MDVEFTLTEDEYVKANQLFNRLNKTTFIIYIGIILAALLLAITSDDFTTQCIVAATIVGGVMGYVITRFIYAPWKTKKQYRHYQAAREPVLLAVSSDGLHFKSELGESSLEWSRLYQWRENNHFVLIYQAPDIYHILPRRVGPTIELVEKFLLENGVKAA